MPSKLKRQVKIKEILSTKMISSHEILLKLLNAENISVTQATLSRDFAEMGVVRVNTELGPRYILSQLESGKQLAKLVGLEILSVQQNEQMVVLRTLAGRAQGVAHYIDRLNNPTVIGTVAGDDTVLIIPDSVNNLEKVINLVNKMMIQDLK